MTEPAETEQSPTVELHFDKQDLEQFEADDVTAGRAIGKMLSIFFLYTLLAMAYSAWWTWGTLTN